MKFIRYFQTKFKYFDITCRWGTILSDFNPKLRVVRTAYFWFLKNSMYLAKVCTCKNTLKTSIDDKFFITFSLKITLFFNFFDINTHQIWMKLIYTWIPCMNILMGRDEGELNKGDLCLAATHRNCLILDLNCWFYRLRSANMECHRI